MDGTTHSGLGSPPSIPNLKKFLTAGTDGGIFPFEIPSFQITLACAKLTLKLAGIDIKGLDSRLDLLLCCHLTGGDTKIIQASEPFFRECTHPQGVGTSVNIL